VVLCGGVLILFLSLLGGGFALVFVLSLFWVVCAHYSWSWTVCSSSWWVDGFKQRSRYSLECLSRTNSNNDQRPSLSECDRDLLLQSSPDMKVAMLCSRFIRLHLSASR
jgi:hypothetical protein